MRTPRNSILTGLLTLTVAVSASTPASAQELPDGWLARISHEIESSEYHFSTLSEAVWSAPNRAHDLRIRVEAGSITLEPRVATGSSWQLRVELASYGRGAALEAVETARPSIDESRLELQRGALREWYVNDARGLEQGFTLVAAPPGDGEVVLDMTLEGGLGARIPADSREVRFRGAGGGDVLRYGGLLVLDAEGRELPARLALVAGHLQIRFDDRDAAYPVVVDPIFGLPGWTGLGGQTGASFGFSVATAGDVNADGYSDVIVGAYLYDAGQANEGRAFVYHGSPSGLSSTAAWTAEPNQADANLGYSVATAGDVNGDGYSDVIVGLPGLDSPQIDEGGAFVYLGSAGGLFANPSWNQQSNQPGAHFGFSVASAGDLNDDGYDDIVVGAPDALFGGSNLGLAYAYPGGPSGPSLGVMWLGNGEQPGSDYGHSVAGSGDVNGDGYDDIIIRSPRIISGGMTDVGRVYVAHGAGSMPAGHSWSHTGDQGDALFGWSVNTAGDVDGDGYADILIGAQRYDVGAGGIDEGRVELFEGSASGLSGAPGWIGNGQLLNARFGCSVAPAGDVNGDGYADVIIGAFGWSNGESFEGAAFVYQGGPYGLSVPVWSTESNQIQGWTGYSVATAGDVNGDGFSDVLVGAFQYDDTLVNEGLASLYYGEPDGIGISNWTITGSTAGDELGAHVATAGDVNGDGFSDILIGAPGYDDGQMNQGLLQLHRGSSAGPVASPAWVMTGTQMGSRLGSAFSSAGDVDGDGFGDIIVGVPRHDYNGTDAGWAFLRHGSAGGLGPPVSSVFGDAAFDRLGASVAAAGDVNGDGFGDVLVGVPGYDGVFDDAGIARLYLGSASGLQATPIVSIEGTVEGAELGAAVATAGDVDADGFSDIVLGASSFGNDAGTAYVFRGSALGLDATDIWQAVGDQNGGLLGSAVAGAGDVDGDGYSDVLIGSPGYGSDAGRFDLFLGSATGLSLVPAVTELGAPLAQLGAAVAAAGDIDADGLGDFVVGEPGMPRFTLYYGSSSGFFSTTFVAGPELLGASVGSAGDVNGDGFDDLIVGAPGADTGGADAGWAAVYYGNAQLGRPRLIRQAQPAGIDLIDRLGRSDSETAFRILVNSYSPAGRGEVSLQWEVKPLGLPLDGTGLVTLPMGPTDTGLPDPFLGSVVLLSGPVTGLAAGGLYHWRVRVTTDSPFFPRSPWFSPARGGWSEMMVRTYVDPPGVQGLTCSGSNGEVQLDWENAAIYDSIQVVRDGGLVATLPPSATSFLDVDAGPGDHTYDVIAFTAGLVLEAASCDVSGGVPPVENLDCQVAAPNVLLSWQNPVAYDVIEILRDGVFLTAVPGTFDNIIDVDPGPGPHAYDAIGYIGPEASVPASCAVVVPPPEVMALTCEALDPCACDYSLTWVNGGAYDSIDIVDDGTVVATLPGTATSHTLVPSFSGSPICVRPIAAGTAGADVCCIVSCPVIDPLPPVNLTCTVNDACQTTVTWQNPVPYENILVTLDGQVVASLPGDIETVTVPLPAPGSFELCLFAETVCGDPVPVTCCEVSCDAVEPEFIRGDFDGSGSLGLVDAISLLNFLFVPGSAAPPCTDAADVDDSGSLGLVDPVALLNFLFVPGSAPPAAPYPECGPDGTDDPLECLVSPTSCP